jgi:hypothetical protein
VNFPKENVRYVEELIARLETDDLDELCLLDISEALRMARTKNFVTVSDRLNDEGITEDEAKLLRSAVFEASRNKFRPQQRFELLLMCLRDGDIRVLEEVEFEAARLAVLMRESSSALYQTLMAIQSADIDVFPPGTTSFDALNLQENHEVAMTYLSMRGLFGKRNKAHFDHLAASPKKQRK